MAEELVAPLALLKKSAVRFGECFAFCFAFSEIWWWFLFVEFHCCCVFGVCVFRIHIKSTG